MAFESDKIMFEIYRESTYSGHRVARTSVLEVRGS